MDWTGIPKKVEDKVSQDYEAEKNSADSLAEWWEDIINGIEDIGTGGRRRY